MKTIRKMNVKNIESPKGNKVPNQFIICADNGRYFQSYDSIICFAPYDWDKPILLDRTYWDYSKTTGKYRNQFLEEDKKETERKIKEGIYKLVDLN